MSSPVLTQTVPQVETSDPERITALRLRYRELCDQIVESVGADPEVRWEVFCRIHEVREELLPLIGNDRALLASDGTRESQQTRALELLGGSLAHFQTEALGLPEGEGFERRLEALEERLRAHSSWEASQSRTRVQNGVVSYRTVQEDVLLQELFALQEHLQSPQLRGVLQSLELLRARDTATALWNRVGIRLQDALEAENTPRVLSVGAGLAQFETLLHRETGARVQTIDLREDLPDEQSGSGVEHLQGCFLSDIQDAIDPAQLVILKDVLHHTEDPEECLRRAVEKLPPEGVLFVIEPSCNAREPRTLRTLRGLDSTEHEESLQHRGNWEALFESVGLSRLSINFFPSGEVDNNDSFPRITWILQKTP